MICSTASAAPLGNINLEVEELLPAWDNTSVYYLDLDTPALEMATFSNDVFASHVSRRPETYERPRPLRLPPFEGFDIAMGIQNNTETSLSSNSSLHDPFTSSTGASIGMSSSPPFGGDQD